MDFFENSTRVVNLWTKVESQNDRGTYSSGWTDKAGNILNEVLHNGAEWVKKDIGFVHTEINQQDGIMTIIIQRRSLTDEEDPIVEVLRSTVEYDKYFQAVIWRRLRKDNKWTLTKPDRSYDLHAAKAKYLAWVNSDDRMYDGATYDTTHTNGFSLLDTLIEFESREGRKEILNAVNLYAQNYYAGGTLHHNKLREVGADVLVRDARTRDYEILNKKL